VVAFDIDRGDWRTFKAARIEGDLALDGDADPHPEYDGDSLFRDSVGVWSGDPVDVTIRLTPEVAPRASEYQLINSQVVELSADGGVIVRARVSGLAEVVRWILSWGGAAEALAPDELREAVKEELAQALGAYSGAEKTQSGGPGVANM
jgi:predicted DNA-binding transcriptional regulator YafY